MSAGRSAGPATAPNASSPTCRAAISSPARLALDRSGRIRALAVEMLGNVGAHPVSYVTLNNGYRIMTTVYDIPAAHVRIRAAFTNTMPVATYRGAGRPESHFVLERLIDIAARRLGIDRLEIRRRNLIRREQLPYRTAMGLNYDSGDFPRQHGARASLLADWPGAAARKAAARKRGKRVGIGIASYVEAPVGAPHERVRLEVRDGAVEVHAGTQSTGQGHETTFAQVLADRLGVAPHLIRLVTGDSDALPCGGGSHSDRSMRLAGALLMETSAQIVAQARAIFAALAGVDEADVTFDDGTFGAPRSNLRLDLFDIARATETDPNLPPELRKPLCRRSHLHRPHAGASDRLRGVRGRGRSRDRRDRGHALCLGGRCRPADQSAGAARAGAWRHRAGSGPGAVRASPGTRGPGAQRELHGLRDAARRHGAGIRRGAGRGSDRRQCATREGRRRGRHHAGARGGDQCGGRCAVRIRRRAHRDAGDAGESVGGDRRYSGTTAVASISIFAAFSTSPATCTTAIAGKKVPMVSR